MEELYVFGTGNAAATRCYNTCFAIKKGEDYFMIDAGGGNGILSVLDTMNVDLSHIHHIFATHEHTDHILGIIWMVRSTGTRIKSGNYEGDLNIYCHKNLVSVIDTLCRLTLQKKFYDLIGTRIHLIPVADGETRSILGLDITFFDIHSTKAEQYGFTTVLSSKKRLSFCGDEPYNPKYSGFIANSSWLLHEIFCLYRDREIFKPYEKHHSTVADACRIAEDLKAEHLILWHTEDKHLENRKELYVSEGSPIFSGELLIPNDREIIQLS